MVCSIRLEVPVPNTKTNGRRRMYRLDHAWTGSDIVKGIEYISRNRYLVMCKKSRSTSGWHTSIVGTNTTSRGVVEVVEARCSYHTSKIAISWFARDAVFVRFLVVATPS